MTTIRNQNQEGDYTTEQEVSYLLDKQDNLKKTLNHYNSNVANFEEKRDTFFQKLLNRNQIDELRNVSLLFDKMAYVESDVPDFIIVDVPDKYKNAVDINKEYYVVSEDDVKQQKKLCKETIERIMMVPNLISKEDLLKTVIAGNKKHVAFSSDDTGVVLNNRQYSQINNNGKPESIKDYSDEIFQLVKKHCLERSTVDDVCMKPHIDEHSQTIIYSWA
jgi:hypothetical protein